INNRFMNDYTDISKKYADKISAGTAKLKQNVSVASQKNRNELAQLKSNVNAYKDKSRKMAEETIKSAEYHIEYIRKHMNTGSSFADKLYTLELNLNNARSNYNNGMYEASYSFAEDIKLMAIDVFSDMMIEKNEIEGYRTMLIAEINRLKSIVDANSEITFEYEGMIIKGSIYDYSEGLIEGFRKSLEDVERKSMEENISLKELKKCYNELSMELVPSFEKILKWSLKNLENSYIRIDVAQTITDTMAEQNFIMTERGYKGDSQTNDLYIKYKNSITKEEIMVIIKPEDKQGTIGTSYEVHQLTEGVNPDRQEEVRNDVNRGIIEYYDSHDIYSKPCAKETVGKASRMK
ncbi:MAG: hypothetical protein K2J39_11905, partial [Ruminococcus sp.]|nr:hypothetical protein [Ruminococcus sp.]